MQRWGWRQSWIHGSMIYGHLWSELIPSTRPACCITELGHSPGGTARGDKLPLGHQPPPEYHSHTHFLVLQQFVSVYICVWFPAKKKKWSFQPGHLMNTRLTPQSCICRSKQEGEWQSGEGGGPSLGSSKLGQERYVPTELVFNFTSLCRIIREIYSICSSVRMETDF